MPIRLHIRAGSPTSGNCLSVSSYQSVPTRFSFRPQIKSHVRRRVSPNLFQLGDNGMTLVKPNSHTLNLNPILPCVRVHVCAVHTHCAHVLAHEHKEEGGGEEEAGPEARKMDGNWLELFDLCGAWGSESRPRRAAISAGRAS